MGSPIGGSHIGFTPRPRSPASSSDVPAPQRSQSLTSSSSKKSKHRRDPRSKKSVHGSRIGPPPESPPIRLTFKEATQEPQSSTSGSIPPRQSSSKVTSVKKTRLHKEISTVTASSIDTPRGPAIAEASNRTDLLRRKITGDLTTAELPSSSTSRFLIL